MKLAAGIHSITPACLTLCTLAVVLLPVFIARITVWDYKSHSHTLNVEKCSGSWVSRILTYVLFGSKFEIINPVYIILDCARVGESPVFWHSFYFRTVKVEFIHTDISCSFCCHYFSVIFKIWSSLFGGLERTGRILINFQVQVFETQQMHRCSMNFLSESIYMDICIFYQIVLNTIKYMHSCIYCNSVNAHIRKAWIRNSFFSRIYSRMISKYQFELYIGCQAINGCISITRKCLAMWSWNVNIQQVYTICLGCLYVFLNYFLSKGNVLEKETYFACISFKFRFRTFFLYKQ